MTLLSWALRVWARWRSQYACSQSKLVSQWAPPRLSRKHSAQKTTKCVRFTAIAKSTWTLFFLPSCPFPCFLLATFTTLSAKTFQFQRMQQSTFGLFYRPCTSSLSVHALACLQPLRGNPGLWPLRLYPAPLFMPSVSYFSTTFLIGGFTGFALRQTCILWQDLLSTMSLSTSAVTL